MLNISDANFDEEVLNSSKPVFVDFWATWCGPCRMMSPIIDELEAERPDIKFCKLNVDEDDKERILTKRYKIFSIPAMHVFRDGERIGSIIGSCEKEELVQKLDAILNGENAE